MFEGIECVNKFRYQTRPARRVFLNAVALLATAFLGGCNRNADEVEDMKRMHALCRSFTYVAPEWKAAASDLRRKIQLGQIVPYDGRISFKCSKDNLDPYCQHLKDAGKTTVDTYDVFEGNEFRFKLKMPVYHRSNGPLTLSAPPSVPISCAGIDNKSLYDYF